MLPGRIRALCCCDRHLICHLGCSFHIDAPPHQRSSNANDRQHAQKRPYCAFDSDEYYTVTMTVCVGDAAKMAAVPTAAATTTHTVDTPSKRSISSYRHILKGQSGTYTFDRSATTATLDITAEPRSPTHIEHIGTLSTYTSVGIYFSISKDRSFAAHMNAQLRPGRKGVLCDQRLRTLEQRNGLFHAVQDALEQECVDAGWRSNDAFRHFGQDCLVTCERVRDREMEAMYREGDGDERSVEEIAKDRADVLPGQIIAEAVFMSVKAETRKRFSAGACEEAVKTFEALLNNIELDVQGRSGFVVKQGGDGKNVLGEVLKRRKAVEAVWDGGGGSERWTWEYDVSERVQKWKRVQG